MRKFKYSARKQYLKQEEIFFADVTAFSRINALLNFRRALFNFRKGLFFQWPVYYYLASFNRDGRKASGALLIWGVAYTFPAFKRGIEHLDAVVQTLGI